jgi:hypothetical protein
MPLSNGVVLNVTSIVLTAGDWDVTGTVGFNPATSASISAVEGGASNASAALPLDTDTFCDRFNPVVPGLGNFIIKVLPTVEYNVSVPTTIYLVALALFTADSVFAYGTIRARRMR